MKIFKVLIFLISAYFGVSSGIAQSLFPGPGHIWNVSFYDPTNPNCPANNGYFCYASTYSYGNDTIVNGIIYHSLLKDGDPAGLIREDTLNKLVYLHSQVGSDDLLYDFNLQIGDTLKNQVNLLPWIPGYVTVSNIDVILVNGVPSKRFHLTGPLATGVQIIENVGANVGPLGKLQQFEASAVLDCFGSNGLNYYPSNSSSCNPLSNEINAEKDEFFIHPNPFSDHITLSGLDKVYEASVYTLQGRCLKTLYNSSVLNLSELPPGCYLLHLSFTDKSITRTFKIIKVC